MPVELHQGWGLLTRNMVNPQNEARVDHVTRRIAVHGERHGYRAPNTRESSRAMGMEAYLAELGLAERVLYDAQGNLYDPQAVEIRIAEGIRQWSNGEGPPRHKYEPPSRAQMVFRTIYDYTRARDCQQWSRRSRTT